MVVGYKIGKRPELDHLGRGTQGSLIEANVDDRIDLENRVAGTIVPWGHWV